MHRECAQCHNTFEITQDDLEFYDKISPVIAGVKQGIPLPTLCALCRMQRRLAHRNTRHLHHSSSALTGEPCITMYDPLAGLTVYTQKEWWSDSWDPHMYGRPIDFSLPFFPQFVSMRKTVPRFNVYNRESENSEFVNYAPHNKNCYLIFGSWFNQDCLYGDTILESRNCIDCFCLEKSELSYEQVDCDRSYNCAHCQACSESSDSVFCFDCRGVRNCIGCWNLRNRENCIFNEPASKEEISTLRKQFSSWIFLQEFRTEFQRRKTERAIHKATTGANNENCTGDFLFQCKDVTFCFTVYRGQDIRYSSRVADQKDTADVEGAGNGELLYESMSTDFSYGCVGCTTCENLHNCFYCDLCFNCNDCFGCISLRRKQYCILNVQYTKEEYERTVSQLIALMRSTGEWCEFLPVTLSPFCYNETVANEHFPFTKEAVLQRKWQWKDPDPKQYMPQTFSTPDAISDVPDKISVEILGCGKCTKNYKITPQELSFYKEHRISVPRNCPDCRHMDRLNLRNPRKLWDRKCSQCERRISTSYAPDRPEIVYCEECYLMEVY